MIIITIKINSLRLNAVLKINDTLVAIIEIGGRLFLYAAFIIINKDAFPGFCIFCIRKKRLLPYTCLLYTSDAADD